MTSAARATTMILFLACGLASGDEPVAHKRGELYGIDLAVAKQRFQPELKWLRGKATLTGKLALERVDGGLRISGLAQDARYAGFGLRDGDVLHVVNFKPVQSADELRAALVASAIPGMWELAIVRDGRTLELMYFDNDDEARLAPLMAASPPSSTDRASARDDGVLPADIKDLGHGHYTIARRLVDRFLSNPGQLSSQARFVPALRDGKPSGFKVYAIRPASALARLGLENGDEIRAVNGVDLSTAAQALELYTTLRTATDIHLAIDRHGQPILLDWTIR